MMYAKILIKMKSFFDNEDGATAIEYALIAGGISIMVIAGVTLIGVSVSGMFQAAASGF